MSWPDRGHHVPALTVTSGGRGAGFDMHAWGRLDHRTLEATSQPSSSFLLFFASFVLPLRPLGLGLSPGRGDPLRLTVCSMTLRTQARPTIEFVSGKEGLRPFFDFVFWNAVVRHGTPWYAVHGYGLSSSKWPRHWLTVWKSP